MPWYMPGLCYAYSNSSEKSTYGTAKKFYISTNDEKAGSFPFLYPIHAAMCGNVARCEHHALIYHRRNNYQWPAAQHT